MKKVVLSMMIMLLCVGSAFAQKASIGSVTVMVGSLTGTAFQMMTFGGGLCLFPVRYFGGGVDVELGSRSYDIEQSNGSVSQTYTDKVSGMAIDAYFAPHIDVERGRIYPMVGITVSSAKIEESGGGSTVKTDYGTNLGLVFGIGAEVLVKNQIVLGMKIKNRLVSGTYEETSGTVKTTQDIPVGNVEAAFTVGINF